MPEDSRRVIDHMSGQKGHFEFKAVIETLSAKLESKTRKLPARAAGVKSSLEAMYEEREKEPTSKDVLFDQRDPSGKMVARPQADLVMLEKRRA